VIHAAIRSGLRRRSDSIVDTGLPAAEATVVWQERTAVDGAGSTQTLAAAVLGTGQADRVAKRPEQGRVVCHIDLVGLPIDDQLMSHLSSPFLFLVVRDVLDSVIWIHLGFFGFF
jgi:hypothetical protein